MFLLVLLTPEFKIPKKRNTKEVSKFQVHCLTVHTVGHCLVHIIRNAEVGGNKVLESMPVLHYIPSIARQPAFDLRMGEAKYQ